MRAVIQRVHKASVAVDHKIVGEISSGLLIFLGIKHSDSPKEIKWMSEKILNLRIFDDENGMMNRSVMDTDGEILLISQFTLYGDCRKGRRPGYSAAARPELAEPIYNNFVNTINKKIRTATGQFQAEMAVSLINNGPVTLMLDSDKTF